MLDLNKVDVTQGISHNLMKSKRGEDYESRCI